MDPAHTEEGGTAAKTKQRQDKRLTGPRVHTNTRCMSALLSHSRLLKEGVKSSYQKMLVFKDYSVKKMQEMDSCCEEQTSRADSTSLHVTGAESMITFLGAWFPYLLLGFNRKVLNLIIKPNNVKT